MFPQVLEHIARRNGKFITLKLEDLQAVSGATTSKPVPNLSTSVRSVFSGMSLYVACSDIISVAEFAAARTSVRSFPAGA